MVPLGRADIRLCNVESSAPVGGEHVELATTREAVLHPVGARRGPDLAGVCGRRIFRWRASATTGLPFAANTDHRQRRLGRQVSASSFGMERDYSREAAWRLVKTHERIDAERR